MSMTNGSSISAGRAKRHALRGDQRGLTLLEVLVALLVLSIGMVGMAALHVNSLQNTHSAYYRSLATTIALDFEEQVWLALANNSSICADDGAEILALQAPFAARWDRVQVNDIPLMRLPVLGVNLDVDVDESDTFATIQMLVSWEESRLGQVAEQAEGRESFRYDVRIPCGV